jgi:hypothetical protein
MSIFVRLCFIVERFVLDAFASGRSAAREFDGGRGLTAMHALRLAVFNLVGDALESLEDGCPQGVILERQMLHAGKRFA